jgi:hypothetical protein
VKFPLQKYLSVIYLLLFVFQIAIFHSTTVKNLSIQSIQAFSDESDDSEPSSDKEDLIDYENDDENEDNQENEEEQEIDGEGDFVKDIGVIALVDESNQEYYTYYLFYTNPKVKEHFAPPECVV